MINFFEGEYKYDKLFSIIKENKKIDNFFASKGLNPTNWQELLMEGNLFFKILINEFGERYGNIDEKITNEALNLIVKEKQLEFDF